MKIVLSHPIGNQFVRAISSAMLHEGFLTEFDTSLALNPTAPWLTLLPNRARQELIRRAFPVPTKQIHTHPLRELGRQLLPKIGLSYAVRHERGWASVDAVFQAADRAVAGRLAHLQASKGVDTVYAYEDGALASFTEAKKLGIRCIYDLPIAYWETGRRLMREEAERLPRWAPTLGGGTQDSLEKLERKTRELELADVVIGPSDFVIDSLPAWSCDKPKVMVPFGSPIATERLSSYTAPSKPLRVLFAGSMGQRKGLGDLFEAVRLLNRSDLELVVLGTPQVPLEFYKRELPGFVYEPNRPHGQVLELMRTCDVFCLPSIVEGRALVMQEAMSQGLPLLITPNTGGEDLVEEGRTGFLVPIRSPEAIAEKLVWFLDNRGSIPEMGKQARRRAANYTWDGYGKQLLNALLNPLALK